MTQPGTSASDIKSPLVAAQKIVTELEGMSKDNQSLTLKFVIETLGLQLQTTYSQMIPAQEDQAVQQTAAFTPGHSTDIKSYVGSKSPKSDQQFAAVVAYFYQFVAPIVKRKDSIDAITLKDSARLASWPQARDWNMTLNNATRTGYLNRSERGTYKLSSVGENLVAITLPGNGDEAKGNSGSRKKPAKKAAAKRPSKKPSKKGG